MASARARVRLFRHIIHSATTIPHVNGDELVLRSAFAIVQPISKVDTRLGLADNSQGVTIRKHTDPIRAYSVTWPELMRL